MMKHSRISSLMLIVAMASFGFIWGVNALSFCTRFIPMNIYLYQELSHPVIYGSVFIVCMLGTLVGWIVLGKANTFLLPRLKHPFLVGLLIFVLSFMVKVVFVIVVDTKQYSDFELFYWITNEVANHTTRYLDGDYFGIWAYQIGFPTAMSVMIKIFGAKTFPLILANCAFLSVTNACIYLIARQFIQEKTARMTALIYLFMPFVFGLSTVYTNQHLASMLFYIGIWILTVQLKFSIKRSLGAGLIFAIGNVIRPEAITILLALVVLIGLIFFNLASPKISDLKMKFKEVVLPILVCVGTYLIISTIIPQFFIASGINPHGLSNNFPLYKFVVGFNQQSEGTFSKADADYLFENDYFVENPELRDEEAAKMIKERLSVSPKEMVRLMASKIRIMWSPAPFTYSAFVGFDLNDRMNVFGLQMPLRMLLYVFTFIDFLFYFWLFAMCGLSMFVLLKAKKSNPLLIFLTALFLVVFGVYWFIEVQHRYSYFAIPALYILATTGMAYISNFDTKKYRIGYKLKKRKG